LSNCRGVFELVLQNGHCESNVSFVLEDLEVLRPREIRHNDVGLFRTVAQATQAIC
jgi:hypothetical protein